MSTLDSIIHIGRTDFVLCIDGCDRPEQETLLTKLIAAHHAILPRWLGQLTICVYEELKDATARIEVLYRYRRAALDLPRAFFGWSEDKQRRVLAHELLHVAVAPLHDSYRDFVRATTESGSPARSRELDRLTELAESVVQDLSEIVLPLIAPATKAATSVDRPPHQSGCMCA